MEGGGFNAVGETSENLGLGVKKGKVLPGGEDAQGEDSLPSLRRSME